MKRNTKIALVLAGALGVGAAATYAHGGPWSGPGWGGQGMMGPGMMGQGGPGMMGQGGYGMMGPGGYGPGGGMMGRGMMGPGGYGPGGGMMGPGMMGPGMMGPGGPGGMGGPGGYGHHGPWAGGGPGAGGPAMMGPGAGLDALAERLDLTDEQKPLLEKLRSAVEEQRAGMAEAMREGCAGQAADATPPERMRARVETMAKRLAGMQKVAGAMEELWAALTPEQRERASGMLGGGMGHHGPRGGKGWGRS